MANSRLAYISKNLSKIIRRMCGVFWGIEGLGCLAVAYLLWQSLQVYDFTPGSSVEQVLMAVASAFGILFLLYAAVQFTREGKHALARFFQKRVPNLALVILIYVLHTLIFGFFTIGEISLRPCYKVPFLIIGGVFLLLDLCVNLGLFPDQWRTSALVQGVMGWMQPQFASRAPGNPKKTGSKNGRKRDSSKDSGKK